MCTWLIDSEVINDAVDVRRYAVSSTIFGAEGCPSIFRGEIFGCGTKRSRKTMIRIL